MIRSMTGYAAQTITITKGKDQKSHISLQLKTLNSRYFELNAKLPPALSYLETELIKIFKKGLVRGYVTFSVYVDNPSIFKGAVMPALSTAHSYKKAIKVLQKEIDVAGELSVDALVRLPNIFMIEEQAMDKQTAQAVLDAAQKLITLVTKEREKEGVQLKKDINSRLSSMKKEIAAIAQRFASHMQEQKQRLADVMKEIEDDASDLADARKGALYAILDKIDIHEEIVRFESHLKNLHELISAPGTENGKRIDFTLQELAREINTITAKCSDSTISSLAINVKVEIEKAREQAQNIV